MDENNITTSIREISDEEALAIIANNNTHILNKTPQAHIAVMPQTSEKKNQDSAQKIVIESFALDDNTLVKFFQTPEGNEGILFQYSNEDIKISFHPCCEQREVYFLKPDEKFEICDDISWQAYDTLLIRIMHKGECAEYIPVSPEHQKAHIGTITNPFAFLKKMGSVHKVQSRKFAKKKSTQGTEPFNPSGTSGQAGPLSILSKQPSQYSSQTFPQGTTATTALQHSGNFIS